MKTRTGVLLPILIAIGLAAFGVERALEAEQAAEKARRNERLLAEIAAADRITDNREALRAYLDMGTSTPEVQLRILQRQWLRALEILRQVQLARYNRVLEDEVPALYAGLSDHLDAIKERCGTMLTGDESLRNEVAWRVYNIEGAARLLAAFAVLETERNWKKAMATMEAAIGDFKSAIETVDAVSHALNLEKNVPRWNLELLHADIYVKRMGRVSPDQERLGLRDNLEAVIPEKGGYAPGEPLERRILK